MKKEELKMKYKEWLIIWLNNYMDDSLADIKTTVKTVVFI